VRLADFNLFFRNASVFEKPVRAPPWPFFPPSGLTFFLRFSDRDKSGLCVTPLSYPQWDCFPFAEDRCLFRRITGPSLGFFARAPKPRFGPPLFQILHSRQHETLPPTFPYMKDVREFPPFPFSRLQQPRAFFTPSHTGPKLAGDTHSRNRFQSVPLRASLSFLHLEDPGSPGLAHLHPPPPPAGFV